MKLLYYSFILFSYAFSFLHSQEYEFEKLEIDSYPRVRLYFTGKNLSELPKESISILEKTESEIREIEYVKIIRPHEKRALSVIFSVGLSTWKKNKTSKQIVTHLLNEFSDNSKFILHFYHTKTTFLAENLSKQAVRNKLQEMELAQENDLLSSLGDVYEKFSGRKIDLHLVVAPSDTKTGDVTRFIAQRKEFQKVPILLVGADSLTYKALASSSGGKFISINDFNLNFEAREYISKFQKPFIILEYESTLGDITNSFLFQDIKIEISIGNKNVSTTYTITPLVILLGWFSNVQVVLFILLITLAFLILIAYARYQRKKRIQWEEYLKKQEELRKSDLYYHENVASYDNEKQNVKILSSREVAEDEWQKFEEEELELDLSSPEQEEDPEIYNLPPGESYEKAFFIQKEGPNPGRQFFINKDETIIGRDPQVDLVLLDSTISLRHAKVKRINKTYYIFDMVSERGVLINGKKLLKPRPLYDFDEVRLGKVLLLFRGN